MSKRAMFVSATLVILTGGFMALIWPVYLSDDARYSQAIRRMREQILAAQPRAQSRESSPTEERGRVEVIRALQTALANAQCELRDVSREQVRAIAEELRRTDGDMLRTRRGTYQLWQRLEAACPSLRNYERISQLREMQAEGVIPTN